MKRVLIVTMFLGCLANFTFSQSLSIDSCYSMAVRNYPLIKQYDLIEQTKEFNLNNASKAYLPQLSITAIEGYIFGGLPGGLGGSSDFKFIGLGQLNQTIWDGGATKTQKEIITAASEVDKAQTDVSFYELRSRINQMYFGILLVNEQLRQLEVQSTILGNNIDRLKKLNENGLVFKTDVDEIRVEQLKLNQQKTELEFTRDGYLAMLSLFTGIQINGSQLVMPSVNSPYQDLAIKRPESLLFNSQRNLIKAQAGMQRVSLMPKVGLLGAGVMFAPGISFGPEEMNSIGVAGLSASWNISGLYKNDNEKKITQQRLSMISVQEETFLFNTKLQMTQTSARIDKQKAILTEDDEIVELRQSIREGYQLKYDTGSGPLIDLLNATEKESDARAQRALHEMQLMMALYDYKTISGN